MRCDCGRYNSVDPKNQLPCLKLCIHACDLSNPAKPWACYQRWTGVIMEEFFAQAQLEMDAGAVKPSLPTREGCNIPKFQLAFLGFIKPLFETMDRITNLDFAEQIVNLTENIQLLTASVAQ